MRFPRFTLVIVCFALMTFPLLAQSPNGAINGLVLDPSNQLIVGADVIAVSDVTGVQYTAKTNSEGVYVLPNLPPGPYRVQVSKAGFKTIIRPDITLNVQDALSINFTLPVGATLETVTVTGGAPLVNSENASVSTVVDRQFAENLPLNGRSFQTLIYLTPGVVAATPNPYDNGQFSVNGQRTASNYWTVDGVSANIGVGVSGGYSPGNGLAGAAGGFSVLGGTNSLVSVDALQEFRIQTSTFAPEFGRTPGGQISIVTRSGTNQWHGSLFEFLRNDALDANNFFNSWVIPSLPKPKEEQNDFGGTLSGPIIRNRTFFFFSYEGLRLRLPQTTLTNVPDLGVRRASVAGVQPYLSAYPLPNGADNFANGIAQFSASYSDPATLDAYSIKIDHRLTNKWSLFARYSDSPSKLADRGESGGSGALSTSQALTITTETLTGGATWNASSDVSNDLRLNYSLVHAGTSYSMDGFGGAVPPATLDLPAGYGPQNALFDFVIGSLGTGEDLRSGKISQYAQHQINLVDTLSWQLGSHNLKLGVDFRRLAPASNPATYRQSVGFYQMSAAETGLATGSVAAFIPVQFLFRNLGAFAQDSWRVNSRITITYGLRWDVDWAPSSLRGPEIPAVTGYDLLDFSNLNVAPRGTSPFPTRFGDLAPRIGMAYQFMRKDGWQDVLRGGFGVFYDLANSETGDVLGNQPPFGNLNYIDNQPLPWLSTEVAPPSVPTTASLSYISAFNPKLRSPYTLEWNLAFEQALGKQQTVSISAIGAAGKHLLQTTEILSPPTNPKLQLGNFIDNTGSSDYNALQIQFQRRLYRGMQALAAYTWSHSIDNGSAGSFGSYTGLAAQGNMNRGNSDFDLRNTLSTGLTFDAPAPHGPSLLARVLQGWSTENFVLAHSAAPVDLSDYNLYLFANGVNSNIRPDYISGQPMYLYGSNCSATFQSLQILQPGQSCPGGRAFNPGAFTDPPYNPNTFSPTRQGNLPRNTLRGFNAVEWDVAIHRDIPIHESLQLQFRAELFNVVNHPNFGAPNNRFGGTAFGLSQETLAQSLSGGSVGAGGFDPLYQIGGPRSIQLALKLRF